MTTQGRANPHENSRGKASIAHTTDAEIGTVVGVKADWANL